ncbi:MAG: RNAse [Cyanobacteria bacterium RYN_339]|nr:RNAse [Cyanobacteria bacterium RYN_339]
MTRPVEALVERLGFAPGPDPAIWREALTHSSSEARPHYERLEFLGDAVLKLVVSVWLYERYPGMNEGQMSTVRGRAVSDEILAVTARSLDLGPHLILGTAEKRSQGREKVGILASAFEALLAAVYLTHGYAAAAAFLDQWLAPEFERSLKLGKLENHKALLQEYTQAKFKSLPAYRVVAELGPVHDRTYEVEVLVAGEPRGLGRGKSKQSAEQAAAAVALADLGVIPLAPEVS